jgi:ArsR family transcriptional regulator
VGTKVPATAVPRSLPAPAERADGVDMNSSTVVEATPADLSGLDAAADATALLAVAAEPVRWRLLAALADTSRCVCDLQPVGAVAPNLLSYHLRVLREAGLVTATRRGRWIDYALADGALERLHAALPAAVPAAGTVFSGCG